MDNLSKLDFIEPSKALKAELFLFNTLSKYLPQKAIGHRFCLKELFTGSSKYVEQGQGYQGWMGIILFKFQAQLGLYCVGKNDDDVNEYEVVQNVDESLCLI